MAAELTEAHSAWARAASRSPRASASAIPAADGKHLLAVDDPGPGPAVRAGGRARACRSRSTSAIRRRSGSRSSPDNERWDELRVHPEWSFCGPGVPSWQQLYDAFERLVARHPKTTFIGVHFGNDPEDPGQRRAHARQVPELLHRHRGARARDRPPPAGEDAALLRQVPGPRPVRHRHRHRRRRRRHDVRLDRRRRRPPAPTRSASSRRPGATSRRPTASSRARRPIQGRWKIDGVGLPESVLRKIYFENAARVLRWRPPGT